MALHKILFVDDEESILKSLERLFLDEDYEIMTASSGENALEKIEGKEIALVISDQMMPGMQGVELLTRIKDVSPDIIGILLTGHSDTNVAIAAINSGTVHKYIEKPWDDEQVKLTVKRGIEQYDLVRRNRELTRIIVEGNEELDFLNDNLEKRVEEKTEEIRHKNIQLQEFNERLRNNFVDTVKVFATVVEIRDEYVGGHSKRVAAVSKGVAAMYQLSEDEMLDIEVAALLHDIGKIGLEDRMLEVQSFDPSDRGNKEIQEQHAIAGQMCLLGVEGLQEVANIIRHHHENYDGSGVPDGLRGNEIPLGSRIISVVDAFDSLRFRREPQAAMSEKDARHCIRKLAEGRFDPDAQEKLFDFIQRLRNKETTSKMMELSAGALRENMVLARDVVTEDNMLLIASGEVLKQPYLDKICYYVGKSYIQDRFFVHTFEEAKAPASEL